MSHVLEKPFEKMGARLKVTIGPGDNRWVQRPFTVDIGQDEDGEYFFLRAKDTIALQVLNVAPRDRHLLLMLTENQGVHSGRPENREKKAKFLCGHDERHWFVAAIPESASAKTVEDAKNALRPVDLPKEGNWIRQGEWFFIPKPEMQLGKMALTLHNEPLVRRTRDGRGGKAHIATECYRTGGQEVLVHSRYAPQGFTDAEYKDWLRKSKPGAEKISFTRMTRNAMVFVRGEIRHPDHKTLKLGCVWHEVKMNRENESLAMASMVFLD
jgi:hypothetical protein